MSVVGVVYYELITICRMNQIVFHKIHNQLNSLNNSRARTSNSAIRWRFLALEASTLSRSSSLVNWFFISIFSFFILFGGKGTKKIWNRQIFGGISRLFVRMKINSRALFHPQIIHWILFVHRLSQISADYKYQRYFDYHRFLSIIILIRAFGS